MLKKTNLSIQAYDELAKRIVSGKFTAGEMLREEKISEEFGISRTPVREALQKLEAEGLVEQLPRRGYRVSMPDEEALNELFLCRAELETAALRLAFHEIPVSAIDVLEKKIRNAAKKRSIPLALEADTAMHELIMDYAGNRYLCSLIRQFMRQTAPFRRLHNLENLQETAEQRLLFLNALKQRNAETASTLLHAHILQGKGR